MIHSIRTITFGLFLLPCFLMGAEKKAIDAQKQRDADAERFAQIAAAFGGKRTEQKNKSKFTDIPSTPTDIRPKL